MAEGEAFEEVILTNKMSSTESPESNEAKPFTSLTSKAGDDTTASGEKHLSEFKEGGSTSQQNEATTPAPQQQLSFLTGGGGSPDSPSSSTVLEPPSSAPQASLPTSSSVIEPPSSAPEQPASLPPPTGQKRIDHAFLQAQQEDRLLFGAYFPAGYPSSDAFVETLLSLEKGKVDLLFLGVPSSPLFSGETPGEDEKLEVSIEGALNKLAEARKRGLKLAVVLVTYLNSLFVFGADAAVSTSKRAGVDGFLVVDMPLDEAEKPLPAYSLVQSGGAVPAAPISFVQLCNQADMVYAPLVSPTTSAERLKKAVQQGSMIYLMSRSRFSPESQQPWEEGVPSAASDQLQRIQQLRKDKETLKVIVGFEISCPTQVEYLAGCPGVEGFVSGAGLLHRLKYRLGHSRSLHNKVATFLAKPYWELTKKRPEFFDNLQSYCLKLRDCSKLKAAVRDKMAEDTVQQLPTPKEKVLAPVTYGIFGGRYLPDDLAVVHETIAAAFEAAKKDPEFVLTLKRLLYNFAGRPTPITAARKLSEKVKFPEIYLKREDLNHTGSHKINNAIGQILLAKRLGKTRIIAATGAGQHGVATAAASAFLGLECTIYMGALDAQSQNLNVVQMRVLGANLVLVRTGTKTSVAAAAEAMKDWTVSHETAYLVYGSCIGPDPYPAMVAYFQSIIGQEAKAQMLGKKVTSTATEEDDEMSETPRCLPDYVVASTGIGSNAVGTFSAFVEEESVSLVCVEGGGSLDPEQLFATNVLEAVTPGSSSKKVAFSLPWKIGRKTEKQLGHHAAVLTVGSPGIFHGCQTYLLQDAHGNVGLTSCISAGLNYPGVGPQLAHWKESGRITCSSVTDNEALEAMQMLAREEGILPALESSHAVAWVIREAELLANKKVLIVLSGRGDKDLSSVASKYEQHHYPSTPTTTTVEEPPRAPGAN